MTAHYPSSLQDTHSYPHSYRYCRNHCFKHRQTLFFCYKIIDRHYSHNHLEVTRNGTTKPTRNQTKNDGNTVVNEQICFSYVKRERGRANQFVKLKIYYNEKD